MTNPTDVVVKVLDSELVRNLFSPVTKELGLGLGDIASAVRFYLNHNLGMVCKKWAESRGDRPVSTDEFRKVLPLLQLAAMQSDEELQARWAALLQNTATSGDGGLPSFGQTLSQLTPEEARYIGRLWALASQSKNYISEHPFGRDPVDFATLIEVYDPHLIMMNSAERQVFDAQMTADSKLNYEKLLQAELVIHDLERLGIITHQQVPSQESLPPRLYQDVTLGPIGGGPIILRTRYSFTQYGVSFVQAVTPRESA